MALIQPKPYFQVGGAVVFSAKQLQIVTSSVGAWAHTVRALWTWQVDDTSHC